MTLKNRKLFLFSQFHILRIFLVTLFLDITYHIFGDDRKWTVKGEDSCWIDNLKPDTLYDFTIYGTRNIFYSDNATLEWLTHMYAPTVKTEHRTHTTIKLRCAIYKKICLSKI